MEFCLNLCEILNPLLLSRFALDEIILKALKSRSEKPENIKRIYIGSSFCSQYFLNMKDAWKKVIDYAREKKIAITLTLPIFSQKDLESGKLEIEELLSDPIDEVTVNDLGNLRYIRDNYDVKINLGRLFFKDPRDARIPGYYEHTLTRAPAAFSLIETFGDINGVEIDQITENISLENVPESLEVISLHYPYCYMTTGNICKFASIGKPIEEKFRPNARCGFQCAKIHEFLYERFKGSELEREFFRYGRTVYFNNDSLNLRGMKRKPDRLVFFPLKELALMATEERH